MSHYHTDASLPYQLPTSQTAPKIEPLSPVRDNASVPTTNVAKAKPKRYSRPRVRCRSPTVVQRIKKTRRLKANDRERNRMHSLNHALEKLRVVLPPNPDETKLTKIETLRVAIMYISRLTEVLENPGGTTEVGPDRPPIPYLYQNAYGNPGDPSGASDPISLNPDNLEALLSGFQWPASPMNSSWCVSESSEDSCTTNIQGHLDSPMETINTFSYDSFCNM